MPAGGACGASSRTRGYSAKRHRCNHRINLCSGGSAGVSQGHGSPTPMSASNPVPYKNSRLKHFFSRLRSYFLWIPLIFAYTGVLGTLSLLASLFDGSGRLQHWYAHLWSWLIVKTTGAPVAVIGMDQIDTGKPHLYAVNHISAMDIPVLYAYLPFQFRIVAKHELFRYPFLGWHLRRSGEIDIDPQNAMSSLRSMNRAVQTLRGGMPIVVFPEGGRSRS